MKCCIFIQSLQHSPNNSEMKGARKVSSGPSLNTPLLEMQHLYQGHKPSIMTAAVFVLQFVGIRSPLLKSLLKLWQHKWSWTEPSPRVLHHFLGSKAECFSCVIMGGITRYCDEKKSSLKWKYPLSTEHEPGFLFLLCWISGICRKTLVALVGSHFMLSYQGTGQAWGYFPLICCSS